MVPLRMSEERANALLESWHPGVMIRLEHPRIHRGELHHPVIQIYRLWMPHSHLRDAYERAAELPRYLEGLRLLSCCRGFDPEENPAFWRHYFSRRSSVPTHKIIRGLFTSIEVVSEPRVDPDIIATTLSVLLSTSRAATARDELEQELGLYIERRPPPCEITLRVYVGLSQMRRALQRLTSRTAPGGISAVGLLVHSSDPVQPSIATGADADELVDTAVIPCVRLEEVHLRVDGLCNADLSALMRELVRHNAVREMTWVFECRLDTASEWQRPRRADAVAALCSALPELTTLKSLELGCHHGLFDNGNTCFQAGHRCGLWQWLAYALVQRKLRGLSLSLEVRASDSARWAFEDAYARTNCLEAFVPIAQFAPEAPSFLPSGVTAELEQGTIVAPLDEFSYVPSVMTHATQRVNVIAQGGLKAVVVFPGVGLMTTPLSTLQSWHQAAAPSRYHTAQGGYLVESLMFYASDPEDVVKILTIFGVNLTHLCFVLCPCIEAQQLQKILLQCPKLIKLTVARGAVRTLEPLFDAFARHETHIRTLIFDEVVGVVEHCVNALVTRGHPMASTVKELQIGPLFPGELSQLALAVRESKRLEFLRVTPSDYEPWERKVFLDTLLEQPLPQNERSRLALYTFLLVVRRKRVLREFPTACLEIVAQFVAIPVLRCVSC